jgi:hypothetical protein
VVVTMIALALCFCCVRACGVGERGKGERLLTLDLEGSKVLRTFTFWDWALSPWQLYLTRTNHIYESSPPPPAVIIVRTT